MRSFGVDRVAGCIDDDGFDGVFAVRECVGRVVERPDAAGIGCDVLLGDDCAGAVHNLHAHFVARAAAGVAKTRHAALDEQSGVVGDEVCGAAATVDRAVSHVVNGGDAQHSGGVSVGGVGPAGAVVRVSASSVIDS